MKKALLKILVATISLILVVGMLVGCTGSFSTTMKDWGTTDGYKNGGFVRETENYVYVINGQGKYSDSNTFGTPIKGSLVAIAKEGFGTESQKAEIVIPKLLVGTDYNAGVYIYGDYVYYATPSTDKNPDGEIANTNLAFSSSKLDGTGTKIYFTLEGLSTEFRVVKAGEDVIFVFYDSAEKEIATYNVSTGERKSVIKTDNQAESESLDSYTFVDNSAIDDAVVVYTTKVYSEEYDEVKAKAQGTDYSRGTESFNNVYAYKAGEESAELVLDGKYLPSGDERELALTYTVNLIRNGLVYYKQIDVENIGVEKHFSISVSDLYGRNDPVAVTNSSDVASTTLIINNELVYKISDKKIVKTTLTSDVVFEEETVATVSDIAKLWFVDGEYIYYSTNSNVLMRVNIDLSNRSAYTETQLAEQRVSDGSVHTAWYPPEKISVGNKTYALVCDNSALGCSYIKAIDLSAEIQETEEDGEITERYIDSDFFVAVLTDLDISIIATKTIDDIDKDLTSNGNVVFDTTDAAGKPAMQAVLNAREVYENLTKKQKGLLEDKVLKKIEKYEKAVEVSNALDGLKDFDKAKTSDEKEAFRSAYESAKPVIEKLEKTEEGREISAILVTNYRWFYQEADAYFNPAQD